MSVKQLAERRSSKMSSVVSSGMLNPTVLYYTDTDWRARVIELRLVAQPSTTHNLGLGISVYVLALDDTQCSQALRDDDVIQ